ncbi:MAG TPA: hypothetical protein VFE28_15945 [Candidatus Krumholzibacteria bacterium]|nr:hypothetical protein [Candidatus Krumholzibacteria bacterium]
MRLRPSVRLLPGVVLALAWASPGHGQYLFGQNKVVYSEKDWKVITTPHLDVYFYAGEQELAEYVAAFSEQVAVEYDSTFQHTFKQKIPFILYASHHDFKQTNVIDLMISEYVGGFTELLRGRVAIPHTGSWTQLREVIRHELVHAYMNDKLATLMTEKHRYNYGSPPLWFTEGLAEYIATPEPGTEARMFMRDFIVNESLVDIPNLWRIQGTFLMYKEGESLVRYIATRFGQEALVQLLEDWWISDSFEQVLHYTLGISVVDLNRDWKRYLKRRYYPAVMTADWPDQHGRPLTHERAISARPAVVDSSAVADSSFDFVYVSSASGHVDLIHARAEDPNHYSFRTLAEGGRDRTFESIPAFSSGPAVHGRRVAFTAKSGERDALFILDLETGRKLAKHSFEALITLSTPTWSPDGRQIAIVGLDRSGWSDLYRIDLSSGELERLTFDAAHDRDPDWSHDGRRLAWSSDRAAPELDGVYHLWTLDLESGVTTQITQGEHDDAAPSWGPEDGSLLFSSDMDGANNIYRFDFEDATVSQLTSTLGGLFTPRWTPKGDGFVATSFSNLAFNVYRFDMHTLREVPNGATPPVQVAAVTDPAPARPAAPRSDWLQRPEGKAYPKRKYDTQFGLDFVQGGVAYDPDFYSAAGAQFGFTDVLGNHRVSLLFSTSSEGFDDFFRHLNVGVSYTNLTRRLHYTLGAFHLTRIYDPNLDMVRFERRLGGLLGVAYPLSRFERVESSFVVRYAELDQGIADLLDIGARTMLVTNFTSFVHDNTMWSYVGPIDGTRYNITMGHTFDPTGGNRGLTSLHLDFRKYFRLPARSVFASRLIARGNWGGDAQLFFLGGPFDLRGYERRSLFARRILLLNEEVRFPLLDRLLIGLPFINALEFGGFRGALFVDGAYVPEPFTPGWYGSYGAGVELGLGVGFIARYDFGRTTDFGRRSASIPGTGQSFQRFFMGWNF